MPQFVQQTIKSNVHIPFPDKYDRVSILGKQHQAEKYLQGKTYKEIKKLMEKIGDKENFAEQIQQIEKSRKLFGEKAVKIPEVKWDDVGGLANAKDDIL